MSKTPRNVNTVNLIEILKMSQRELKFYLYFELRELGYRPIFADGFLYAEGDIPIAMVAHMDTVHIEPKYIHYANGRMRAKTGLGADDRAGIYSILHLARLGYKPTIIFTEDEEIGCVGAKKFADVGIVIDDLKYIIELDRRGKNDAVFYDCDNRDFVDYITSFGFEEQWGSFSDICEIAPKLGVSAVNLSIGYEHEHTKFEYLSISAMARTIRLVEKMLSNPPEEAFEYIELTYSWKNWDSRDKFSYTDEYMANYGYVWSTEYKEYVKSEESENHKKIDEKDKYPLMMEGAWLVFEDGDLIDLDEAATAYYIDTDEVIRNSNWEIVNAYPVDYNFISLNYMWFYNQRYGSPN